MRRAYNRHSTANSAWEESFKREKGLDAKIHKPIVLPKTWENGLQELGIVARLQQK